MSDSQAFQKQIEAQVPIKRHYDEPLSHTIDDSDNPYLPPKLAPKKAALSKTTGRRAKKENNKPKDLFDVIQEIENESDEGSSDSLYSGDESSEDETGAKAYYGSMYPEVMTRRRGAIDEDIFGVAIEPTVDDNDENKGPQFIDVEKV